MTYPTLFELKARARRLRQSLARDGTVVTHSRALELLAQQYGLRDWNTLRALAAPEPAARSAPHRLRPGAAVSGQYLGHAFTGRCHALTVAADGKMRVTVQLDTPIDVVRFDSFSSFRSRITAVLGRDGRALRRTSDGVPHMILDLATVRP